MHVLVEKEKDGNGENKEFVKKILEFLEVDWNLFWIYKLSLDALGIENVIEIIYKMLELPFIDNYISKLQQTSPILHDYCLTLIESFRLITQRFSQFY